MAPRPGTGKGLAGVFNKAYEAYANDSELDEILALADRIADFADRKVLAQRCEAAVRSAHPWG